ncbi:MAG TPA: hypothetical protein VF406_11790 [Thermodesulfobacteriota bacterium]
MRDDATRMREQGEMVAHLGAAGLAWSEAGVLVSLALDALGKPRAARVVRLTSAAVLVGVFTAYHLAAVRRHREASRANGGA